MPSSFHPHALRHLTTRSARVRSRSQPIFSLVPGLSSEPSSQPLGGCRCALMSRCLSCADRRTERHARLAFSRSAGLAHRLSAKRKASAARDHSAAAASPRGTCLRDATTGAAPVCHHRSISLRCGTCLRFALSGAARSRLPLSGQSVIGTFPHPRSAAAAVRCAGKATVPCSFLRSAALTLRSLLQIPVSCLSAQGITARLAAPLKIQISAQIGAQNARHASLPAASV